MRLFALTSVSRLFVANVVELDQSRVASDSIPHLGVYWSECIVVTSTPVPFVSMRTVSAKPQSSLGCAVRRSLELG